MTDMTLQDVTDHVLTTKSVESRVYDGNGDSDYGHICLYDWDETAEHVAIDRADELPGITILLRSSEGSYHAWNLSVADKKTTACRLLMHDDDETHNKQGLKRGYWRLRIGPKEYRDGEVYKERPELVTVVVNTDVTDAHKQSRPHLDAAKALYDIPEPPNTGAFTFVGDSHGVQTYATMTDELKDNWAELQEQHE